MGHLKEISFGFSIPFCHHLEVLSFLSQQKKYDKAVGSGN